MSNERNFKQAMSEALDKLPFIATPFGRRGRIVLQRQRIGDTLFGCKDAPSFVQRGRYHLTERVERVDIHEQRVVHIVHETMQPNRPIRGATIVNGKVDMVVGFDHVTGRQEELQKAATELFEGFLQCRTFFQIGERN